MIQAKWWKKKKIWFGFRIDALLETKVFSRAQKWASLTRSESFSPAMDFSRTEAISEGNKYKVHPKRHLWRKHGWGVNGGWRRCVRKKYERQTKLEAKWCLKCLPSCCTLYMLYSPSSVHSFWPQQFEEAPAVQSATDRVFNLKLCLKQKGWHYLSHAIALLKIPCNGTSLPGEISPRDAFRCCSWVRCTLPACSHPHRVTWWPESRAAAEGLSAAGVVFKCLEIEGWVQSWQDLKSEIRRNE